MKFIHIADLHLGSSFLSSSMDKNTAKERREDLFKSFEKVIKVCKNKSIDFLLIAGDLFEDDYVKASDVKRIVDGFKQIPDTNVVIAAGNHDYLYEKSFYNILNFPSNVKIFKDDNLDKFEFEDLNTCIYGLSFTKKQYKESKLENVELDNSKNNILLMHCDTIDKFSNYMPVNKEDIEKIGFDYCALGHIHKAQKVFKNAFYAGSLEPLDFSERGYHGFIYGELNEHKLGLKLIKNATKEFITLDVDISGIESISEVVSLVMDKVDNYSDNNLYRINFYGTISELINMDDIILKLNDEFEYVEVNDKTVKDLHIGKLYIENKDNIIGHYIDALKDKEGDIYTDALYLGLEALLNEGSK